MGNPMWERRCYRCGRFVPRACWAWFTGNWPEDEGISHEPECPPRTGCRAEAA